MEMSWTLLFWFIGQSPCPGSKFSPVSYERPDGKVMFKNSSAIWFEQWLLIQSLYSYEGQSWIWMMVYSVFSSQSPRHSCSGQAHGMCTELRVSPALVCSFKGSPFTSPLCGLLSDFLLWPLWASAFSSRIWVTLSGLEWLPPAAYSWYLCLYSKIFMTSG